MLIKGIYVVEVCYFDGILKNNSESRQVRLSGRVILCKEILPVFWTFRLSCFLKLHKENSSSITQRSPKVACHVSKQLV